MPDVPEVSKDTSEEAGVEDPKPEREPSDDDEAVVEDVDQAAESEEVKPPPPMKKVTTESWIHLNDVAPLWQR